MWLNLNEHQINFHWWLETECLIFLHCFDPKSLSWMQIWQCNLESSGATFHRINKQQTEFWFISKWTLLAGSLKERRFIVMAHSNVWWVDVYFEMAKFAVRVFYHAKLHYQTSRTMQTVTYLLYVEAGCLKFHPFDLKKPITNRFFKKWPAHFEMSKTTHHTAHQLHSIISSYRQNFPHWH